MHDWNWYGLSRETNGIHYMKSPNTTEKLNGDVLGTPTLMIPSFEALTPLTRPRSLLQNSDTKITACYRVKTEVTLFFGRPSRSEVVCN